MLRISIGQINPTIGDVRGNLAMMTEAASRAAAEGAQLLVFPELSLTGYYPGDLLDEPGFLRQVDEGLYAAREATRSTPGLYWVVGAPVRREGPGKLLFNALLVLRDGDEVLRYAKQLLPNYGVFSERRHFEPGPDMAPLLDIAGTRVGFMVCEDGWNDRGLDYAVNPFVRFADARPDVIVLTNASPSNIGKRDERHELFTAASRRHGLPLVWVNQVGGQDQLVFDGASFLVTPQRGLVFEARRFEEDVVTVGFAHGGFTAADGSMLPRPAAGGLPATDFYRRQIVLGLRDYARRCGFQRALVGSSGGIDSALTLALAVEALGADKVAAITMPSRISSEGSVADSAALCRNLGIPLLTHPIGDLVDTYAAGFARAFGAPLQGLALENLQARVRGTILMEYSNTFGHLLLTTGNKSEISVGYCTLYGDTNGGLGLIGDLYKTDVYDLCRHLNANAGVEMIPTAIIEKPPSAELAPGQRDTDSLPPYPLLDCILKRLIEGERLGAEERAEVEREHARLEQSVEGRALVRRIHLMVARSEYKRRQAPPILRLRARAFGSGRQMPIAARYDF